MQKKTDPSIDGQKILVVDDDEGILDALEITLETEGYTVETSTSGTRVLQLQEENQPHLILLDVLISGTDGRELCKQLKTKEKTKDIPIIMLSAAPNVEESVREAHADDFIAKPFDIDTLLTTIKKYLV